MSPPSDDERTGHSERSGYECYGFTGSKLYLWRERMAQEKMDRDDEISLLKKRRYELETIKSNLEDILDWFEKNEEKMSSEVSWEDELDGAIDHINILVDDIGDELDDLTS